jgi:hypothetical protein
MEVTDPRREALAQAIEALSEMYPPTGDRKNVHRSYRSHMVWSALKGRIVTVRNLCAAAQLPKEEVTAIIALIYDNPER